MRPAVKIISNYFGRIYKILFFTVNAVKYNITLTHDGPVVLGGTITFKADFFENGRKPKGTFKYEWRDNAMPPHEYKVSIFIQYFIEKSHYHEKVFLPKTNEVLLP